MITSFQTVQDSLIALGIAVGLAIVFAIGIVVAAALSERDKARNARNATPAPVMAQHLTETDDVRELVLR
jgi:hypothetical protein